MNDNPLEVCIPGLCTRGVVFVELLLRRKFGLRLGILPDIYRCIIEL